MPPTAVPTRATYPSSRARCWEARASAQATRGENSCCAGVWGLADLRDWPVLKDSLLTAHLELTCPTQSNRAEAHTHPATRTPRGSDTAGGTQRPSALVLAGPLPGNQRRPLRPETLHSPADTAGLASSEGTTTVKAAARAVPSTPCSLTHPRATLHGLHGTVLPPTHRSNKTSLSSNCQPPDYTVPE